MRLNVGLFQQQTQKQILSPQMIQSMEILVLNQQQLEDRISGELEENVTLERDEQQEETAAREIDAGESDQGPPDAVQDDAAGQQELTDLTERYEQLNDLQKSDFWSESSPLRRAGTGDDEDHFEVVENTAGRDETLPEHLIGQLSLKSRVGGRMRALCEEIIYNLDDRGWLIHPLEEIHSALVSGISLQGCDPRLKGQAPSSEEMHLALEQVQQLDPVGVGASDLIDCLCIQLHRDPGENQLEEQIVREHLDDLARNRLPHIARQTGQSLDQVKLAVEVIAALEPIPGRPFRQQPNSRVVPDVLITEDEKGKLIVEVNSASVPRLKISPHYREMLKTARDDPELRKYLKKRIENAEWLMGAVVQRSSTLQRVAEEVTRRQEPFFRGGDRHLQPLRMQDVADAVGVNVSTVSRAISGKWFQAPGMIRELRSLFTSGTVKDDGSQESRGGVIARIQELIEKEDARKPLSDAQIVKRLTEDGIRISRRTVTKYREAEGIPSSRERRQH
jgi:RNA polymerase sigma-54 factor